MWFDEKATSSTKKNINFNLGLKQMLDEINPLAQTFRMAQERIRHGEDVNLSIKLLGTREPANRVYNTPTASEIAALIVEPTGTENKGRDIVIHHKTRGLQNINELHPSYMALQYPLLFPYGEDSYHTDIPHCLDPEERKKRKRSFVTMREYYAYRIQQRLTDGQTMLCGGRLFQQFLVDCCCAIESERLWFIKNNQDKFRCEMLNNICDAVNKGDCIGQSVGKRVYLPASFTGSPRYMQQHYQDAMAICRWYGNPHLFITFTANAKWPEIEAMLKLTDGQKAEDRPDIVARVFKMKLRQLMNCLKRDQYFGAPLAGNHQDCRYLSASEAAWRIFDFEIQERYPSVMRLPVHLFAGVYDAVVNAVNKGAAEVIFVYGHGGTGKTFLYKTICL